MISEKEPLIAHVHATYGEWFDRVELNGVTLSPRRSQGVINHSPDGFAWGYGGSGPAQLALAILLEVTYDEEVAIRWHQRFKMDFISQMPQRDDWSLTVDVGEWLREQEEKLREKKISNGY